MISRLIVQAILVALLFGAGTLYTANPWLSVLTGTSIAILLGLVS